MPEHGIEIDPEGARPVIGLDRKLRRAQFFAEVDVLADFFRIRLP